MYFYDWTMILVLPGLLLGMWAQYKVKSAYAKYAKISTSRGITAEEVSRDILSKGANMPVSVEPIQGKLTDNFDPKSNTLHLSEGVYGSSSIAAVGIAAHECGHALQQSDSYAPLVVRNAIVPAVKISSNLYFPIFLIGIIASWEPLMYAGIICFAATLVFSLITLPVEFNASHRALKVLQSGSYMTDEEVAGVRAVLTAAALTYVAAAISSLLQLLRLLLIANRRR
ncbi:MAG TPA: zinc metallopeptidase [Candidatus Limiplasma sp.]|nr:zinc metallopeptidase [Candidatus Limiplasma sp.]